MHCRIERGEIICLFMTNCFCGNPRINPLLNPLVNPQRNPNKSSDFLRFLVDFIKSVDLPRNPGFHLNPQHLVQYLA